MAVCIWPGSKFMHTCICFLLCIIFCPIGFSQAVDQIMIGEDGIMRWRKDSTEVTGFGVNYTVPFAYAYRAGKRMNVDLKEAIDHDVYHFSRLGLDLYRVHVWDTEISDTLGNLIDNENLELFDYLLFKLQERGINAVITPIAYWGNGWPERDEPTTGFSHKYGKGECLTDAACIKAQENYLAQFVNHVNRYTGLAYKYDPRILAFEISNEPHHREPALQVTSFVQKMVNAIRSTGCTKPVFYNVSHSVHLAEAYFDGGIDGGTFQWYPTGLGFQKELGGNMLPNVDRYEIPFDDVLKKHGAVRFVYEFDAADMASTYMYPAMARSFRTAGMQLGTHFSYDPTYLAPYNTEYNTHFMNLAYAPQKALSLMICGEIFRNIPLYNDYGRYPGNSSFGPFRVSYEENLAEMLTGEKFIYTNHTSTKVSNPESLMLIAGWGNSQLVEYDGTGAYFFDKMGDGLWRLELMPDAAIVDNLFGRNDLQTKRAIIKHERRTMKINLPEFADGFFLQSVDWRDSIIYREVIDGRIEIKPGVYLVMAPEYDQNDWVSLQSNKKIKLDEYFAPPSNADKTYVRFEPIRSWSAGKEIELMATVISPQPTDKVFVSVSKGANSTKEYPMERIHGNDYRVILPARDVSDINLVYSLTTISDGKSISYPVSVTTSDGRATGITMRIESPDDPITLFEARLDSARLNRNWIRGAKLIPSSAPGETSALYIPIKGLSHVDEENLDAEPVSDYSIRHYFGDLIKGRKMDLPSKKTLVVQATSFSDPFTVQVSLIMKDGSAFGKTVMLTKEIASHHIPLTELKRVKPVILPRPYPTFLPYFSDAGSATQLDIQQIESLQISIGPGIAPGDYGKMYETLLTKVMLE